MNTFLYALCFICNKKKKQNTKKNTYLFFHQTSFLYPQIHESLFPGRDIKSDKQLLETMWRNYPKGSETGSDKKRTP